MKKLYRKGKVHPSPPLVSHQLAFLPAAILALTTVLSPEEREVLAYLISSGGGSGKFSGGRKSTVKGGVGCSDREHPPLFHCDCFRCYMSYWVRWDSSPNRELIHEIIDAFEDGLLRTKNLRSKKERRKTVSNDGLAEEKHFEENIGSNELVGSELLDVTGNVAGVGGGDEADGDDGEEGLEKGSVRSFMSFIGERIWGPWA